MSTLTAAANLYDEVPFPSQPLPQSHPDRLCTLATLFGMRPQPIDRCRVLELGCATGGNLIPMAEQLPESTFVGVDYSARQIAAAAQMVDQLGLKNIELKHQDLADVGKELGQFDYIIAHGLYSWISQPLQETLLGLCRRLLKPQGVAYISHNIYPGWHLRDVIRELTYGSTSADQPPAARLAQGRNILQFFSLLFTDDPAPYSRQMKAEIDLVLRQHDNYLFHEYFEEENHSSYFFEFAESAAGHGLQYLADASVATMFSVNFGPEIEAAMMRLGDDVISVEQHMDLLRNRAFRQTLICHQEAPLVRQLNLASLQGLYLACQVRSENPSPDLKSAQPVKFITANGSAITSPAPAFKAALDHLGRQWPRAVSLDELIAAAERQLASGPISATERENLGHNLVQCVATGLMQLHSQADRFTTSIGPKPKASEIARAQARIEPSVTNRRHELVRLDEVSHNVLPHLDGQHDRAALVGVLIGAVNRGELSILRNGIPASRGEDVADILAETLENSLQKLATSALLID